MFFAEKTVILKMTFGKKTSVGNRQCRQQNHKSSKIALVMFFHFFAKMGKKHFHVSVFVNQQKTDSKKGKKTFEFCGFFFFEKNCDV